MFMNLHTLPAEQSMYTVTLATRESFEQFRNEYGFDSGIDAGDLLLTEEVDFVGDAGLSGDDLRDAGCNAAEEAGYSMQEMTCVSIANQSEGYMAWLQRDIARLYS